MIRSLRGTVLSVGGDAICLDVAGFGLELYATKSVLASARPNEPFSCFAWLQIAESGATLYAFSDETERALFVELTSVKTLGGKLSIAVLRVIDPSVIVSAILDQDPTRLGGVPGLGAKRAERICFELKSKIQKHFAHLATSGDFGEFSGQVPPAPGDSPQTFVVLALTGLGFSNAEAAYAVRTYCAQLPEGTVPSEEETLKGALRYLRKQ